MNPGDMADLTITDVVYQGRGLARLEGMVVFVPGVLVGEKVRARITAQKKRFALAELVEIVMPSPGRIAPLCPLADRCPGCAYQHMSYAEEVRVKQAQLVNFLAHGAGVSSVPAAAPVASSPALGYRNKITLHAQASDTGDVAVGYIGEDNRTAFDVPACPLAVAEINVLLGELRGDGDLMTSLCPAGCLVLRRASESPAYFWTCPTRHAPPDRISIPDERVVENTAVGKISVPATGFWQVNPAVMDELLKHVIELLTTIRPAVLVDAYCGAGLFALAGFAAGVPRVTGFDRDREAIGAARANAADRGLREAAFGAGPAAALLPRALREAPLAETVLLVDPPRTGLDGAVRDAVRDRPSAHVVYVSCAADTLARDVRVLADAGYRVRGCRLFDMFPRTRYFESVTWLTRCDL